MRQPNVTIYGSHTCFLFARALPLAITCYEFRDVDQSPERIPTVKRQSR